MRTKTLCARGLLFFYLSISQYYKNTFRKLDLAQRLRLALSSGSNRICVSPSLEDGNRSEKLCFLEYQTMDKIHFLMTTDLSCYVLTTYFQRSFRPSFSVVSHCASPISTPELSMYDFSLVLREDSLLVHMFSACHLSFLQCSHTHQAFLSLSGAQYGATIARGFLVTVLRK